MLARRSGLRRFLSRVQALRAGLIVVAVALALVFIACTSEEEPPLYQEGDAPPTAPTVTVELPTPTATQIPSPTPVPTRTPEPTPTSTPIPGEPEPDRWQTCLESIDLEPLPDDSRQPAADIESARILLQQSVDTLERVSSLANTFTLVGFGLESSEEGTQLNQPHCRYTESQYAAPARAASHGYSFHDSELVSESFGVVIGLQKFDRHISWDTWNYIEVTPTTYTLPHSSLLSRRFGVGYDDYDVLGIEMLDGVEVYRIANISAQYEDIGGIETFWIGVDDLLPRRIRSDWLADPFGDGSKRWQIWVSDYHSYGEEFSIEAPLTPEEIARPEVSGWNTCLDAAETVPLAPSTIEYWDLYLTDSAEHIVANSTLAMEAMRSYETVDVTYSYSESMLSWGGLSQNSLGCDLILTQLMKPNQLNSREIYFSSSKLRSHMATIIVDSNVFRLPQPEAEWERDDYETNEPFSWPHTEILREDISPSEITLQVVGLEILDGVDVYHLSTRPAGDDEENVDGVSLWIGAGDFLLRRVATTTSVGRDYIDSIERTFRVIEFHSFNQDFNIQPPPDDQIADEDG